MCVCMYVCTYTHIHTLHICLRTCVHVHTYTHTYIKCIHTLYMYTGEACRHLLDIYSLYSAEGRYSVTPLPNKLNS